MFKYFVYFIYLYVFFLLFFRGMWERVIKLILILIIIIFDFGGSVVMVRVWEDIGRMFNWLLIII